MRRFRAVDACHGHGRASWRRAKATVWRRTASRPPRNRRCTTRSARHTGPRATEPEPHRADWLARYRAGGSGNAGDCHRPRGARSFQCAERHGPCHGCTYRPVPRQQALRYTELPHLRGVAVTDHAALKPLGTARDIGEHLRKVAARAGFGGGHALAGRNESLRYASGQSREVQMAGDTHDAATLAWQRANCNVNAARTRPCALAVPSRILRASCKPPSRAPTRR